MNHKLNIMIARKTHSFFILSVLLLFIGISYSSCMMVGVKGNGNVQTEERPVTSFNKIKIGGAFEVLLRQGDKEEVEIEADDNLLEIIETSVSGKTLTVRTDKNIRKAEVLRAYITFTDLEKLDVSGAVELKTNSPITTEKLEIEVSGAAKIDMELEVNKLVMDMIGATEIHLSGRAKDVVADISGACELNAIDLKTETFSLDANGATATEVHVTEKLTVDIAGAGSVRYKGDPKVSKDIAGAGSVKPI